MPLNTGPQEDRYSGINLESDDEEVLRPRTKRRTEKKSLSAEPQFAPTRIRRTVARNRTVILEKNTVKLLADLNAALQDEVTQARARNAELQISYLQHQADEATMRADQNQKRADENFAFLQSVIGSKRSREQRDSNNVN